MLIATIDGIATVKRPTFLMTLEGLSGQTIIAKSRISGLSLADMTTKDQRKIALGLMAIGFCENEASWMASYLAGYPAKCAKELGIKPSRVEGFGDLGFSWEDLAPDWVVDAAKAMARPDVWLMNKGMRYIWPVLEAIFEKVLGKSTAKTIVGIMKTVAGADQAAQEYLIWTMAVTAELVRALIRSVDKKDPGIFIRSVGINISKSILTAPGILDALQVIGQLSGTSASQVKKDMIKFAESDPGFGINVVMFIISLFPWPAAPAKIAANPMKFAADVMGLFRPVFRIMAVKELGQNTAKYFEMVYGCIIVALSNVQEFRTSMEMIGAAPEFASELWEDIIGALITFNYKNLWSNIKKGVKVVEKAATTKEQRDRIVAFAKENKKRVDQATAKYEQIKKTIIVPEDKKPAVGTTVNKSKLQFIDIRKVSGGVAIRLNKGAAQVKVQDFLSTQDGVEFKYTRILPAGDAAVGQVLSTFRDGFGIKNSTWVTYPKGNSTLSVGFINTDGKLYGEKMAPGKLIKIQ